MLSYEQFDKKRIVENVFGEEFAIQVYKNLEKKNYQSRGRNVFTFTLIISKKIDQFRSLSSRDNII